MVGIFTYIAVSVLFGCISCFLGKKLYFPILMASVFFGVSSFALTTFGATWKIAAFAVLGGIVAALLARFLYKLGVFLLGGIFGAGIGYLLAPFLPSEMAKYHWIVIVVLAVLIGACALKWCDLFIMLSTAYNGAAMMATPLCFLVVEFRNLASFIYADGTLSTMINLNKYLNGQFATQSAAMILIGTAAIAVVGFAYQYATQRKKA